MSKIVFHGDSVTLGVRAGVVKADTYAQRVGLARGFSSIVNTGIGGNTSTAGLARFGSDVLAQSPDAVSIMFGINDVYAATPPATYKANLRQMVAMAKDAGIRATVLSASFVRSTPYINAFPAYLDAAQEAAQSEGVPFVDCYREFEHAYFLPLPMVFDALHVDHQHPAPAGHKLIADLICKPANAAACS